MGLTEKKSNLSLFSLVCMAIGLTIGGGIFVLTGVLARDHAAHLPYFYLLASLPMFFIIFPVAVLGRYFPTNGGIYFYPSRMLSPRFAFLITWIFLSTASFGQIPLFTLACSDILLQIFPVGSKDLWAFGVLTIFFLLNVSGIKPVLFVQNALVSILVFLLGYSIFRIVDFHHLTYVKTDSLPEILPGLEMISLLCFTYFGSNAIIELGKETGKPKHLLKAFLWAFPIVVLIYFSFSFAISSISHGDLTLPPSDYLFNLIRSRLTPVEFKLFLLGGPLLAVVTSLNGIFLIQTKSLIGLVQDGWFPHLKKESQTISYTKIFTILYILSALGLFLRWNLETLATYSTVGWFFVILAQLISIFPAKQILKENGYFPKLFFKNSFIQITIIGITLATILTSILLYRLHQDGKLLGLVFVTGFGIIYLYLISKYKGYNPTKETELKREILTLYLESEDTND
ncbi:APC family permease [Leptospira congkakensis]|uniref:APC family permease n=1 Tax=Leptospira congkakensis TaxID=2484932 RepID=A0A4Z1A7D7_9LEPT|nr:APC family permease [Leptospira congkakensis]TGL90833.1 APC family permease [Leptospira congkakensis]TGL91842.1 APC family permease [Leptospira congkakensis]TGL98894.1 APC family permease [Leptospira congkakensis]